MWANATGLNLDESLRAHARTALQAAADWAARNQCRHRWPLWSADTGRFPYHVHLKTDDHFRSTSWNTARMAQGLLSAWLVLRDPHHLDAAECALEYVKSIQYFGPECPAAHGVFLAETPLSNHAGPRDGIECAQALLAHHLVTGDKVSLLRGRAYFDWLLGTIESGYWLAGGSTIIPRLEPSVFLKDRGPARTMIQRWCDFVAALPLLQLAQVTGEAKYARAAEQFGDHILAHLCRPDGGICAKNSGHHTSTPEGYLDNDDGIALALVALATHATKSKYLDAAVANGEWWLRRGQGLPANYSTLPLLTMVMADLARATNDDKYTRFLHAHAAELFNLQVTRDERSLVSGAFLGEDMACHYRKGTLPGDYISLRTTSYGALALGRLACGSGKEWNPAYSAFGW